MAEAQIEGVHEVQAVNKDGGVIADKESVPFAQVPQRVMQLLMEHPGARISVDGQPVSLVAAPPANIETVSATPLAPGDQAVLASGNLAHSMLWTTLDRATQCHAWMLQQSNAFTEKLLENNRRLAEQASELQERFQASMQRIDLIETEKKLIEHDLMARRLSRHAIAQNRAEEEAARPPPPPGQPWLDELIAGVSAFLGAQRQQAKPWEPKN
jgi:hypothetical protein